MNTDDFRRHAHAAVDWIADYMSGVERFPVLSQVKPGDIRRSLPAAPPLHAESFDAIRADFERLILPGVTHWQHPSFFAYFPANNSPPSVLAEMFTAALAVNGMNWITSPAATELETHVLDWLRQMIGLPDGWAGVIQDTASSASVCALLCARERATSDAINEHGLGGAIADCGLRTSDFEAATAISGSLVRESSLAPDTAGIPSGAPPQSKIQNPKSKIANATVARNPQSAIANPQSIRDSQSATRNLTVYVSDQAHSSIEKGAKIAGFGHANVRIIPTDEHFAMDPAALETAIDADRRAGLTPAFICATVGTTSSTAIDPVRRIGEIARRHGLWFHIDAALAGNAAILPEFRWMLDGVELADSLCFNPHKWLLTNFDCCCMFVRDALRLQKTFAISPEYLKTAADSAAINYRDWGIPLGRRFRALKLWFVIRSYGVEGLQAYLRNHIALAQQFASWIESDPAFELLAPHPLNTVCFRYVGRRSFGKNSEGGDPAAHAPLPARQGTAANTPFPPREGSGGGSSAAADKASTGAVEQRRPQTVGMPLNHDAALDALNQRLLDALNATGRIFLTHTKLRGCFALRMAIGQSRTTEIHVREAWTLIRDTAAGLARASGARA